MKETSIRLCRVAREGFLRLEEPLGWKNPVAVPKKTTPEQPF